MQNLVFFIERDYIFLFFQVVLTMEDYAIIATVLKPFQTYFPLFYGKNLVVFN